MMYGIKVLREKRADWWHDRFIFKTVPIRFKRKVTRLLLVAGIIVVNALSIANADFLQMPDVTQMKDLEQKSLLRDIDIPAVRERDPDPTAGPRLAVSEFRIQGLVEYPDLGITREALNELTEKIRFDLMEEGKALESGYTVRELGEISDLLGEVEEESKDRHVTPLDVQRLVWLIREQRGKRGITIGQIESVANTITKFYRERGFVLAKAYIPKQKVRDGIVTLTLLLGMLGEVKVNNNDLYTSEHLQQVFDDMKGKPITSAAVEENLFLINDFPGVFVDGYFEPGTQVGDTRLNINVKNESRFSSNLRVDNHGTKESGLYRLYADAQLNNTLGLSDALNASYLKAEQPSNSDYYRLSYELNLFSPRFRAGIETSKNQFVVDQTIFNASFKLNGSVFVDAYYFKYMFKRSRTNNQNVALRYEEILSDLQLGDIPDIGNALDDKIRTTSLAYNFDTLNETDKKLHQGSVKLTSGSFIYGQEPGQDTDFTIFNSDYSLLSFWKIPFTDSTSRLIYRASLQYAGNNLPSSKRFSIAGPTRARGYSPSLFTADDSLYLGVDWVFNAPDLFDFSMFGINFKELAKPFVFADLAYGMQHTLQPGESDPTAQVFDLGIGLQFSSGKFSGNLMAAFPVDEKFKNISQQPNVDSSRLVFDFQYSF